MAGIVPNTAWAQASAGRRVTRAAGSGLAITHVGLTLPPARAKGSCVIARPDPADVTPQMCGPADDLTPQMITAVSDTRRQRCEQFVQLGARHVRPHHLGFAGRVHPVDGKHVLGEIDADEYDSHGLPLPNELMRVRTSHRGTLLPVAATRLSRDGEVPFIR